MCVTKWEDKTKGGERERERGEGIGGGGGGCSDVSGER